MAIPATIILIGPERSGKSTVGRLLADQLGLPFTDVSKSAAPYYAELGHSQEAVGQTLNVMWCVSISKCIITLCVHNFLVVY
jgi:ATP-dependent protease HslVU (ClpYQ) ATPase subunit